MPSMSVAASQQSDSLFIDADERDLLLRFRADNPSLLCFQETSGRQRTVEECLVECELEKAVLRAHKLMASRRSQMTRESRIQVIPSRHMVPSLIELREKRDVLIDSFDVRSSEASHASFQSLGESMASEVALASRPRNSLAESLATLLDFYEEYVRSLAAQRIMLARRWFLITRENRQVVNRRYFSEKHQALSDEFACCSEVLGRLNLFGSYLEAMQGLNPRSAASDKNTAALESLARQGSVPQPIEPTDTHIYVNHHIFQQRTRRRLERFLTKCRLIPQYKRYDLFDKAVKYLLGEDESQAEESGAARKLPILVTEGPAFLSRLEELCTGFRLSGFEKSDLHEFLYNLGKRFNATHEFQTLAWHFRPLSIFLAAKEASDGSQPEAEQVYLRPSPWASQLFGSYFPRTQPDWEVEQLSAIQTITSLKSRAVATTEADHLRIDAQLQADFDFIAEENTSVAVDYWRKRAILCLSRSGSGTGPSSDFERLVVQKTQMEAHRNEGDPAGEIDSATQQRLQASFQLRYLRTRQFRIHILKALNYLAAVLKEISRDCKVSAFDTSTSASSHTEGLAYSFAEERRKEAVRPMVESNSTSGVLDVDDFEAKLLASFGLDGPPITIESIAKEYGEKQDQCIRDPFWFEDSFEVIDFNNSLQRSNVRDGVLGALVMEEWALAEMQRVEQRMLFTASYYNNKSKDSSESTPSHGSLLDTSAIVEDIFECELWFQQSKLNVIDCLREAYLHTSNRSERSKLAKSIIELVCSVPRLDLSGESYMQSFTNHVVINDLMTSLAREVIQHQIEIERRVSSQMHSSLGGMGRATDDGSHHGGLELPAQRFGFPSPPRNETGLFKSLFPKSSVINVFELYGTMGALGSLKDIVDGSVTSILTRFRALDCGAAVMFLQKEVLKEMLVQWRLIGDEDAISRTIHLNTTTSLREESDDDESSSTPRPSKSKALVNGLSGQNDGLLNPLHIRETVHRVAAERIKEGIAGSPTVHPSFIVEQPSRFVSSAPPSAASDTRKAPTAAEDVRSATVPAPTPLICAWFDAMEALKLQSCVANALYENEIWSGVHRMQAKLMGVNVRRTQLEPMDFDGKRTFVENDEIEAAIQTALEGVDREQMASVFSLGAQLALEDVLVHSSETFQNLSICEFERSMGDFDFRSEEGIHSLLRQRLSEFRRAFVAQVTNKNLFASVVLCNMAALDGYLEGLYKSHADVVIQAAYPHNGPEALASAFSSALYPPRPGFERVRLSCWPLFVKGESQQQCLIDRRQLQRLFVSVNQIKSVHRKCALQEMSHQATLLLGAKQGNASIRKEIRALKEALVDRYCHEVSLAYIQYAVKYQICAASSHLRWLFTENSLGGEQSYFIFGAKNDAMRATARGAASQSEGRKPATCLVAKNGALDEARYVPHFAQVIALSFESDVPSSTGISMNVRPEHFHLHGLSHLKQNFLLTTIASILHNWLAIARLVRSVASCQLPSQALFTGAAGYADVWKSELFRISTDLESLRDPTDLSSVSSYLNHRHAALTLCVSNTLRLLANQSGRLSHGASASLFTESLLKLDACVSAQKVALPVVSPHASSSYFPQCQLLQRVQKYRSYAQTEGEQESTPKLIESLRKIRAMTTTSGMPIDTSAQECEGRLPTVPFNPMEWYSSFSSLQSTRSTFTYLQFAYPLSYDYEGSMVYACLDVEHFLGGGTHEERLAFYSEFGKMTEMVEDCAEDVHAMLGKESEFQTTFMTATLALPTNTTFSSLHYDVALNTARRDVLKELYSILLRQVSGSLPPELAAKVSLPSAYPNSTIAPVEDIYQRNIVHRSRTLLEREAADPTQARGRRKGRCIERDLRDRQCKLLIMEIHKLFMIRTCNEVSQIVTALEAEAAQMANLTVSTNRKHATKTALFSEFCSTLVAKAHCTRSDGDKVVTYHIPDYSLNLAMDTVAAKLIAWDVQRQSSVLETTETLVKSLAALAAEANSKRMAAERSIELSEKALPRRVQTGVMSERFEVIKRNSVLSKENERLRIELSRSREQAREEIRGEFEERLTDLQMRLKTRESQFASYKQKLYRDMQESLEEVRRSAMFSISSMEHAPVHVKRQALKMAISDDELNTLREQNVELKQALLKVKLWYEIKLARAAVSHEKQVAELRSKANTSQQTYWSDKGVSEAEASSLRRDLSSLQVALTKSELEVEVLRKDLQAQLHNKKDLVAWKMQSGKQIEELQKKLRRFEKLSSTYDLEKIVSDYEKRLSSSGDTDRANTSAQSTKGPVVYKGQMLRAATSRTMKTGDIPTNAVVPIDEYRRLHEQCERERKMKEQAFLKIDEFRKGESDASEALVWQRRYLESASELQRRVAEVEALKAHIDSSNLPPARGL